MPHTVTASLDVASTVPLDVFRIRQKSALETRIFLDESGAVDISQSDQVRYSTFEKQANRMFAAMWRFQEINLTRDKLDFYDRLNDTERFILTSNLQRQMMLDSIQSMGMAEAFLPLCSDPMVARCFKYITFFEELHNASYEHILKNVYNDPTEVRSTIKDIKPIVDIGHSISRYYDALILETAKYRLGQTDIYSLKKKLWLCLHAINALEGIRFFESFSSTFAFGQSGRMMGNASVIRLIANDELFHVAFTTVLIRTLPRDDPDFAKIEKEMVGEVTSLFHEVVQEELDWLPYVFSKGSMTGKNEKIGADYIHHLALKRMKSVGLAYNGPVVKDNPMPWLKKWLSEAESQVANQETENTSYMLSVNNDLKAGSFKGLSL